jgi:mannose-6-phosphate isomerase-like protein (cupin superfamily)
MNGYVINLEKETLENSTYRKVLFTSHYSQLVLMSLRPHEEIGEEVHGLDQFLRIEQGSGMVILEGVEHAIGDGSGIVVPAGTRHNVINTSEETDMKLYTVYSPPEHRDGVLEETKADEIEEHFDGKTSIE